MKLAELKGKTWKLWFSLNSWKGELTTPVERYAEDIRFFGDLRRKETWIKAFVKYDAQLSHESCLDCWALITIVFNFTQDRDDYEYRHEIIDEFLLYPNGLDLIRQGIEEIFNDDFASKDRNDAHGFFEFLEERERRDRGFSESIGFTGRLSAVTTATAKG